MSRVSTPVPVDSRKLLLERIAASRYLAKSARLRDLLLYLGGRVIEDGVKEVREQEIGFRVFGREPNYDTAVDNIVRVHASTLRKRLEQYFAESGYEEELVLEIPKGNYAPLFRPRLPVAPAAVPTVDTVGLLTHQTLAKGTGSTTVAPRRRTLQNALVGISLALALAAYPMVHARLLAPTPAQGSIHRFWSHLFGPSFETDVVMDDGAIDLYQQLTGRRIGLSQYYDRSYLRHPERDSKLDSDISRDLTLRRFSSFADVNLLWRLSAAAATVGGRGDIRFARDYSFNSLKTHKAVLLGNSRSNPWIEPFEARVSIRWTFANDAGTPQPIDTTGKTAFDPEDGYAGFALLPNLSGNGSVLILSATGGAAMSLAGDYLMNNALLDRLMATLPKETQYFEALLRIRHHSRALKDISIVISRPISDK